MKQINFHDIPPFLQDDPDEPFGLRIIIETPRGTGHKFKWDEEFGVLSLSRILRSGMVWPCDFGFIPQSLGEDGDPLDVALLTDEATFPGCLVEARLLGVIGLVKDGEVNDRLIACPTAKTAPGWKDVHKLEDISPRQLKEIEAFLKDYNTFEGSEIELTGWRPAQDAMETARAAVQRWKKQQNRKSKKPSSKKKK
ncbi:MAG: inorganic diphosphatase [Abitibacteriaceae bacterium]|nr:inorganic diphosphatase [Abditibacteriaceae bacterium]